MGCTVPGTLRGARACTGISNLRKSPTHHSFIAWGRRKNQGWAPFSVVGANGTRNAIGARRPPVATRLAAIQIRRFPLGKRFTLDFLLTNAAPCSILR